MAAGGERARQLRGPVAGHAPRGACLAHQHGETSGALLDRRMACLARRKAALAEAGTVLGGADAGVALHALEVVEHLPGLERCADLDALANEVAAPGDPELRARATGCGRGWRGCGR